MSHDVIMPQMGESIAEGTITAWFKNVGDMVARDEPLFEISTDKVDAEIPSPEAGVLLEIKVQPGQTVPINTIVAVLGSGSEKSVPDRVAAPAVAAPAVAAPVTSAPASAVPSIPVIVAPASNEPAMSSTEDRRLTKSSPLVRKIAKEHDVDIRSIEGTGISGRVTKQDINTFIDRHEHAPAAPAPISQPVMSMPVVAQHAPGPMAIPAAFRAQVFEGDRVEDMSVMRSKIAEHMIFSKTTSPHVYAVFEIDFTKVAQLRAKHKDRWNEQHGVNLTYTSFIMKATVDALKKFPVLNASLDGNKIIYHRDIHLGLAVALDWGLLVPVVKDAGELNMMGLSKRAVDLATRARNKKLKPEEVSGGTFTITNPGIFGSLFGMPVINQPQAAILGVGAVEKRPVVIDDMIAIRTRAYMSLGFDHRLVDGAVADHFMSAIKEGIENFDGSSL